MGWGSRDAQLTSGSPKFQIHPFPCVDKKHQKLSHYSKTKPCAQLGAPVSVLGGEFAPLLLTQDCGGSGARWYLPRPRGCWGER